MKLVRTRRDGSPANDAERIGKRRRIQNSARVAETSSSASSFSSIANYPKLQLARLPKRLVSLTIQSVGEKLGNAHLLSSGRI